MHYKMIKKNIPPEQGNYSPYSSARVNERALPLAELYAVSQDRTHNL